MTKRSICINPYIYSFSQIQWLYNPRKALDNRFYTMIQGTINWRAYMLLFLSSVKAVWIVLNSVNTGSKQCIQRGTTSISDGIFLHISSMYGVTSVQEFRFPRWQQKWKQWKLSKANWMKQMDKVNLPYCRDGPGRKGSSKHSERWKCGCEDCHCLCVKGYWKVSWLFWAYALKAQKLRRVI